MTAAERWLRCNVAEAPPGLLDAMVAELANSHGPVPEALADAALQLYRKVLLGDGGRECALPLLAADALLTHAMHAQAEVDVAALPSFASRWGAAGRLSILAADRAA